MQGSLQNNQLSIANSPAIRVTETSPNLCSITLKKGGGEFGSVLLAKNVR